MTTFLIIAVLLIAIALLFIVPTLLGRSSETVLQPL